MKGLQGGLGGGRGDGDSPVRAKLAALEMEVEALKRGSEASSPEKDMVSSSGSTDQGAPRGFVISRRWWTG